MDTLTISRSSDGIRFSIIDGLSHTIVMEAVMTYNDFAKVITGTTQPIQIKWNTGKLGLVREVKIVPAKDLPWLDLPKVKEDYKHLEVDGWEIFTYDRNGITLIRYI